MRLDFKNYFSLRCDLLQDLSLSLPLSLSLHLCLSVLSVPVCLSLLPLVEANYCAMKTLSL